MLLELFERGIGVFDEFVLVSDLSVFVTVLSLGLLESGLQFCHLIWSHLLAWGLWLGHETGRWLGLESRDFSLEIIDLRVSVGQLPVSVLLCSGQLVVSETELGVVCVELVESQVFGVCGSAGCVELD